MPNPEAADPDGTAAPAKAIEPDVAAAPADAVDPIGAARSARAIDPDVAVDPAKAINQDGAAGSAMAVGPRSARQPGQVRIVVAVALGGIVGACARHGASLLWPGQPTGFPWTTFWVNVTGCAAMGILMVLITEVVTAHPLVRPFLGTGVLGGYTTFSTYIVDAQHLLNAGRAATALLYLAATLAAALLAVQTSATLTRRLTAPGRPDRSGTCR